MWLLLALLPATGGLMAQANPLSNLRDTIMAINPAGQLLDSLTVAPGSLMTYNGKTNAPLPSIHYQ